MLIPKLAYRNLMGAGLRTWLNVFVLSLAFVMIIWVQGFIEGMGRFAMQAKIDFEIGGGQFWHAEYDPYDPFTFEDSHAPMSEALAELVSGDKATPILIASGALYSNGRVQTTILKGIDPDQKILQLPSAYLKDQDPGVVPALIGAQMAKQAKLEIGDDVTIRWRDIHGTFDADDVRIRQIMNVPAPTVDQGQIWLPLESLRDMLQAPGQASFVVIQRDLSAVPPGNEIWIHRGQDHLLEDITEMVKLKAGSTNILYGLLLFMGLLAIFDTQILSIWRRRKEIGMLMALGMARGKVVGLFTLEGALHGLLALIVGAIYGIPVLAWSLSRGLTMPQMHLGTGIAFPQVLYPIYGLRLVLGTTLLVLLAVTVISFLPASKIAKLKPTDALRGKSR
ncbi:ABC transporter permease [Candidatus Zixiibacteriota bacterium]